MSLTLQVAEDINAEKNFLMENEIKLRICGNYSLIDQKILKAFEEIIQETSQNQKMTLNVCFAYNSQDEIEQAIEKTLRVQNQQKSRFVKQKGQKKLFS